MKSSNVLTQDMSQYINICVDVVFEGRIPVSSIKHKDSKLIELDISDWEIIIATFRDGRKIPQDLESELYKLLVEL